MNPYWLASIDVDEYLIFLADRRLMPPEHNAHARQHDGYDVPEGYGEGRYVVTFAQDASIQACDICGAPGALLRTYTAAPTILYDGDSPTDAWAAWFNNADQLMAHTLEVTRITTS